ncbi:MAG: GatB/YqeY domain-containing protein [Candidatus Chaera renei]|uniref:GatB/YqeY domain-containing protein n=1 Tax=Candidatus Chaera renei TaxID=2506947 RepID=A0A4Q0AJU3_9BACT|nr:MAG: GatB/YqeY domain-containing protein [Candidatus Chaera renei]
MELQRRIEQDIKTALLGGDKTTAETLKGLKSAILYAQKKNGATTISDLEIAAILQAEQKKRDEAAELYKRGGNQAAADKELQEKTIIARYLPTQLSDDELAAVVDAAVAKNPQAGLGAIIADVRQAAGAAADGSRVAAMVKQKLGL